MVLLYLVFYHGTLSLYHTYPVVSWGWTVVSSSALRLSCLVFVSLVYASCTFKGGKEGVTPQLAQSYHLTLPHLVHISDKKRSRPTAKVGGRKRESSAIRMFEAFANKSARRAPSLALALPNPNLNP